MHSPLHRHPDPKPLNDDEGDERTDRPTERRIGDQNVPTAWEQNLPAAYQTATRTLTAQSLDCISRRPSRTTAASAVRSCLC